MKKIFIGLLFLCSALFALSKVSHELFEKKTPINLTTEQIMPLENFIQANPHNQKLTRTKRLYFLVDTQKHPINNPLHFNLAVGSVPITIPKKTYNKMIKVENPEPWVSVFLKYIDGNKRISFKQTPDLLTQFTTSLNKIMYFVKLNHPLTSRHAHGPIHILFVVDPFPPYSAVGTPRLKPLDKLVAYCFEYGQAGDFDSLYNPDGTIMETISNIFDEEIMSE